MRSGSRRHEPRALEVALGVVVGLAVADVLVRLIGVGAAQIAVVVALAMAAAVLVGEWRLLVNQAGISLILVVAFSPDRFVNALVGSGVALAISHLFQVNPERLVAPSPRLSCFTQRRADLLEMLAGSLGRTEAR